MSYKTDAERALNILTTLCPRKVVIVTPKYCDCADMAEAFKSEGYNVLHMASETHSTKKFSRIWNSDDPVMIHGEMSPDQVYALSGHFSLVYLYPNSEKSYADQIMKHSARFSDKTNTSELRAVLTECMQTHKRNYQLYCDKFDNKVFTVLI